MRRPLVVLGILLAVLLAGGPAWAHNQLAESSPAADATLTAAPQLVRLRFLQKLKPEFTTIAVSDAARRRVPTSEPAVDGATGTVTVGEALANGAYTVAYRTVSVDGHVVQGSYAFTVADPARADPPASPVAPAGRTPWLVIGLVALGMALAGLAGARYVRLRRRRPGGDDRAAGRKRLI